MSQVRRLTGILGSCVLALVFVPLAAAQPSAPHNRPRLVVTLVVDQLRKDYLERFGDLFLPPGKGTSRGRTPSGYPAPGGFRYLMERGAQFPSARYRHFPLFTGPGHAVVLTGGYPYKTGIISNDWFSRATGKPVYCVEDPNVEVVGGGPASKTKPMSPANLRSTTVGDELKMATGGAAKVVSLSLKDRAAILLGGRLTDASIWFDDTSGNWVSSTFYCKNGRLPAWAEGVNGKQIPASYFGKEWTSALSSDALSRTWTVRTDPPLTIPYRLGAAFPHRVDGGLTAPGTNYFKAFALTPWANAYVFETAREAVLAEKLGQDEIPDMLAINFSSNDYTGHAFGPNSPEVIDITIQTDRQLAEFFRFLDRTVPGGLSNVTIALTADHGVAPLPETMRAMGFHAGRVLEPKIKETAEKALDARFGAQEWVLEFAEQYLYLNDNAIRAAKADPEAVQKEAARAIARMEGIYAAHPRAQIEEGRLGNTDLASRLYKSFYPKLAGDVLVVTEQLWFTEESPQKHNTTHGSPYAYDTEVPLLFAGWGIRPGTYRQEACPGDIAPTLCQILGINQPSACDGLPLGAALR
jgi:predicted AlkP superfamily pyrophosphatase or phosphodiesterase